MTTLGTRLEEAVRAEDLKALESVAMACRTYRRLRELATEYGVDLDTLEELLAKI